MECSKCGAPGEWSTLYDVITAEGIIKLCKRCISDEHATVIKKPNEAEVQGVLKNESLYKRLSASAGLNPSEHKKNIQEFYLQNRLKKDDVSLRDLIDKKFDKFVKNTLKKREDLVDNFNWIIMRARRLKKITTNQLAQEMGESERVIKMAEQGVLPEGDYVIVKKLQDILGIQILQPGVAAELERQRKQLGFDNYSTKTLTLSDLQKMEKEEALATKEPYWKRFLSHLMGKKEVQPEINVVKSQEKEKVELKVRREVPTEFDDTSLEVSDELPAQSKKEINQDLSQSEIDDILFGRK